MWNREANSEDELDVNYRQHQHLPEPTFNPESSFSQQPEASRQTEATAEGQRDNTPLSDPGTKNKTTVRPQC